MLQHKDGTVQRFRWATMLNHEGHTTHAIIRDETKPNGQTGLWAWLTDHRPNRTNVSIIANKGGRQREKTNFQKPTRNPRNATVPIRGPEMNHEP